MTKGREFWNFVCRLGFFFWSLLLRFSSFFLNILGIRIILWRMRCFVGYWRCSPVEEPLIVIFGLRQMPNSIMVAVMPAAIFQVRMLLLGFNTIFTFIHFVSLVTRNTRFPSVGWSGIIKNIYFAGYLRPVFSDSIDYGFWLLLLQRQELSRIPTAICWSQPVGVLINRELG